MKGKWVDFYSGIAAGTVVVGAYAATKHITKKYGQKPNQDKLIDINLLTLMDYSVKKFVGADDEKIAKLMSMVSKK